MIQPAMTSNSREPSRNRRMTALFNTAIVVLSSFLVWAEPALATITIGDTSHDFTNSGAASTVDSTAKNHAAGNGLLVACQTGANSAQTVSTVTNTAGDSFTGPAGAKRTGSNNTRVEWFYVLSSAGNASDVVRCTWSGNVSFPIVVTIEVIHDNPLSFDTSSVSTAEGSADSAAPVQSFSTAAAGIIAYQAVFDGPATYTAPAGYTTTGDTAYGTFYKITVAAENNITPTATISGAGAWAASAISVTESGGASPVARQRNCTALGVC